MRRLWLLWFAFILLMLAVIDTDVRAGEGMNVTVTATGEVSPTAYVTVIPSRPPDTPVPPGPTPGSVTPLPTLPTPGGTPAPPVPTATPPPPTPTPEEGECPPPYWTTSCAVWQPCGVWGAYFHIVYVYEGPMRGCVPYVTDFRCCPALPTSTPAFTPTPPRGFEGRTVRVEEEGMAWRLVASASLPLPPVWREPYPRWMVNLTGTLELPVPPLVGPWQWANGTVDGWDPVRWDRGGERCYLFREEGLRCQDPGWRRYTFRIRFRQVGPGEPLSPSPSFWYRVSWDERPWHAAKRGSGGTFHHRVSHSYGASSWGRPGHPFYDPALGEVVRYPSYQVGIESNWVLEKEQLWESWDCVEEEHGCVECGPDEECPGEECHGLLCEPGYRCQGWCARAEWRGHSSGVMLIPASRIGGSPYCLVRGDFWTCTIVRDARSGSWGRWLPIPVVEVQGVIR